MEDWRLEELPGRVKEGLSVPGQNPRIQPTIGPIHDTEVNGIRHEGPAHHSEHDAVAGERCQGLPPGDRSWSRQRAARPWPGHDQETKGERQHESQGVGGVPHQRREGQLRGTGREWDPLARSRAAQGGSIRAGVASPGPSGKRVTRRDCSPVPRRRGTVSRRTLPEPAEDRAPCQLHRQSTAPLDGEEVGAGFRDAHDALPRNRGPSRGPVGLHVPSPQVQRAGTKRLPHTVSDAHHRGEASRRPQRDEANESQGRDASNHCRFPPTPSPLPPAEKARQNRKHDARHCRRNRSHGHGRGGFHRHPAQDSEDERRHRGQEAEPERTREKPPPGPGVHEAAILTASGASAPRAGTTP